MYPVDLDVIYSTDEEYRDCLTNLFGHDLIHFAEITNYIYSKTKTNDKFNDLYSASAARVLSEDKENGITLLFSFDFFQFFHGILSNFLIFNEIPKNMYEYLLSEIKRK
jgi:hypothetical protein